MSNQLDVATLQQAMQSSSRANSALIGIYEISKVLTRPARLETALSGVINLLSSFLDMNNGLIALLDEEDRTSTVVGAGWSEATAREHFERLPEQAVGQIVVSGMPLVVRTFTNILHGTRSRTFDSIAQLFRSLCWNRNSSGTSAEPSPAPWDCEKGDSS